MLKDSFGSEFIEAGCDEAGRGPLAGPVFAAAVILPKGWNHPKLNDSKKMSEPQRFALRHIIEEQAIAWAVVDVSAQTIDKINILNASFLAMSQAVERLTVIPELLLIDGNRFRTELKIPYQCVVGGDAKYASIAAASVLAKTYRDEYMVKIAAEFPQYGWDKNKGYPTAQHRAAVAQFGLSPHHRLSFHCKSEQLSLF